MRKAIAILPLVALLLTGCDIGTYGTKVSSQESQPRITVYAADAANTLTYYYVVDDRTGVVYLQFDGFYRGGITVMLNPDGTPVTKDQLELR